MTTTETPTAAPTTTVPAIDREPATEAAAIAQAETAERYADELAAAVSSGDTSLGPRDLDEARQLANYARLLVDPARRRDEARAEQDRTAALAALAAAAVELRSSAPDLPALDAAIVESTAARDTAERRWNREVRALTQRATELGAPLLHDVEQGRVDAPHGVTFAGGLTVEGVTLVEAQSAPHRRPLTRPAQSHPSAQEQQRHALRTLDEEQRAAQQRDHNAATAAEARRRAARAADDAADEARNALIARGEGPNAPVLRGPLTDDELDLHPHRR